MGAMDNGISGCLRKRDRDQNIGFAIVVLCLLLVVCMAAKAPVGPVRGSSFVLVDDRGVERATLTWQKGTMLNLCDEFGESQLMLTVDANGTMVSMRRIGKTKAIVGVTENGPCLVFPDDDGVISGLAH